MPSSRRGAPVVALVVLVGVVVLGLVAPPASALPASIFTPGASAFAADVPLGSVLSSRLAHLAQKAEPTAALPSVAGHVAGTLPISAADDGEGSVTRTSDGRLLVDVRLDATASATTLAGIEAAGAEVVTRSGGDASVTVAVADDHLVELAGVPGVRSAREIITPAVGGTATALVAGLPRALPGALPNAIAACPTGVVSEGDLQLRAAEARQAFGVDGTGVKIGVLSDSYDRSPTAVKRATADVAAGELPGTGNTCAPTPVDVQTEFDPSIAYIPTDEGRAMLQIVHDLAPGSPLAFASAFKGEADMANQIRTMAANGAKVIVDDVSYATEPLYQDGVISAAINDVTAAGVTYLSAAGNSNLVIGGKDVTSYEATAGYRPTACPTGLRLAEFGANDCHDFDPGPGTSAQDAITLPPNTILQIELGWSEPVNGVTNDLDIFLVDRANPGNITGDNTDSVVAGTPTEWFRYHNTSDVTQTLDLYVTRKAGSTATPRFKFILQRPSAPTAVQWDTSQGPDVVGPSVYGHNATLAGGTVGAVRFDDAGLVEEFSSRGPATYCWAPVDGTANPAPPLAGGCRDKAIDVAASNGVQTSFFAYLDGGAWRFYGTSASTPHVAAIAALARQRDPCRTPADVLAALRASGRPVGTAGPGLVGSGLVDAVATIEGVEPCGPTLVLPARIDTAEGRVVTIDWSASAGSRYTSTFVQTSGPPPAAIREAGPAVRKLVAPRADRSDTPTTMTFAVTITDTITGEIAAADVLVSVTNTVPVARIGAPLTVEVGAPVLLAGTSTDGGEPDRAPAGGVGREYRWRQIEGPATTLYPGQGVGFRDTSIAPSTAGRYRFGLTVVDHGGLGAASREAVLTVDVRDRPAAGTLAGVVRDENGAPIPQAVVLVYHQAATGWQGWVAGTDADGRWSLSGLPDRATFLILGGKLGYAARATRNHVDLVGWPTLQSPSATADLTLPSLAQTHSISGSVRTASGLPAVNVPVELHSPDGQVGHATTDFFGTYRFDWLGDGERYRVRVSPPGTTPYDTAWVTNDGRGSASWVVQPSMFFTVAGANLALPAVTVHPPNERRTLTIDVRDGAVARANVELRLFASDSDRTPIAIVRTDAAGRVVLAGLRPGAYTVWADGGPSGSPPSQWYGGVAGGSLDGSIQLADHIDLLSGNAAITFSRR